jgi:hypothetical protein
MSRLMDLVAGDAREILLVIGMDDLAALDEPDRFAAHLELGSGLDPTWLDLFSEAVRTVSGSSDPSDFIDARLDLDPGLDHSGAIDEARSIERIEPAWIGTIARLDDDALGPIAGRWIDLIEDELGFLPREEKPWIRELTGRLVAFCRAADRAPDVLFAWSLQ